MSLTLYNTLTRRKEAFQPIDPNNVRMYVCGPTVYDLAHIGNARPIIVFDVLFRLLRHIYGADHVTYARNITDVDDKINARAVERFPDMEPVAAIRRLTEETTAQFHKDIAALGVLPPSVEPRATEHIEGMKRLCEMLVAKGHAYVAQDHVLFDASSMADYGRLANRSLEEMEAGARVDVAPYKKGSTDFVLWKPSTPAQPGWPSPCGIQTPGRPGWHIECSAMSEQHLGPVFDIHGGGIDLVFPHHENEIAQSRCAHGTPVMANYWMHNGFLQVEGEKMSKSLGNFVTIDEALQSWGGDVIRFTMLKTHYRRPIDWTQTSLMETRSVLRGWSDALREVSIEDATVSPRVIEALSDDMNTPKMIAVFHELYKSDKKSLKASLNFVGVGLAALDGRNDVRVVLGGSEGRAHIGRLTAGAGNGPDITESDIQQRITARLEARKRKDFKESDRIRDELAAMGIQLKDTKNKETGEIETTWEVKR